MNDDLLSRELEFLDAEVRHEVIDAVACALHNKGATLVGNTEALDLEWLAQRLWERDDPGRVGWWWEKDEVVSDETRKEFRRRARVVLYLLPLYFERIGHRCMTQAQVLRMLEKAETRRLREIVG